MPGGDAWSSAPTPTRDRAFREGLADLGLHLRSAHDLPRRHLRRCLPERPSPTGAACPQRVWTYTIGGYQVIKKWLSYRERPLLGRDLTVDEARYVTEMARRIAAILLLEPALDANYERQG